MATHGRGLICVPISNERADQLGLQRMVGKIAKSIAPISPFQWMRREA